MFLRVVFGAILVAWPDAVLERVLRRPSDSRERTLARLLGARNLVEAAVAADAPNPRLLLASAAVDATHALSMAALAAFKPGYRRLATASALAATGAAIATAVSARRAQRGQSHEDHVWRSS